MSTSAKVIRGQVRQVAQELLTEELVLAASKELKAHIDRRMDIITKQLKDVLDQVDTRSKDGLAYMVRNATAQAPVIKE